MLGRGNCMVEVEAVGGRIGLAGKGSVVDYCPLSWGAEGLGEDVGPSSVVLSPFSRSSCSKKAIDASTGSVSTRSVSTRSGRSYRFTNGNVRYGIE